MKLSLSQAAKEAGKSKSRISEAIKDGSLSAVRNGNRYEIDPAELFRRFPKVETRNGTGTDLVTVSERLPEQVSEPDKDRQIMELQLKLEAAQELLAEREARISDLKGLLPPPRRGFLGLFR